ncbi:hypothetical protein [Halobellus ruber]|uniref:Uncharacterized protein n=1 Tax=Halobellus ruber TaxID=2761102 RepID=A0A7J9SG37_9EURY|nr:hypothetical protein [Halobellus ruber]MBB6645079.1 hypothetical protein [Halobellus ruber]
MDPALGPRVLFLGGTIAGCFATVAIVLAVALLDSAAAVMIAGLLPIIVLIAAAYDYGGRDGLEETLQPHAEEEP